MADDYCELCDLPLSTCVHGMPPPPPPPAAPVKGPRAAPVRRTTTARRPASRPAPPPPPPRTLTTPEVLRPHIVAVLTEVGGRAEAEEVYELLETRLVDLLLERDRQTTPEGELRWRTAARRARQSLISEGVLLAGPGVWALADQP